MLVQFALSGAVAGARLPRVKATAGARLRKPSKPKYRSGCSPLKVLNRAPTPHNRLLHRSDMPPPRRVPVGGRQMRERNRHLPIRGARQRRRLQLWDLPVGLLHRCVSRLGALDFT